MRLARALLVIVDISGSSEVITTRQVSLLHAEQIITDLMEAVIDRADHPLTVNKLEGDAALLFREYADDEAAVATRDVLAQLGQIDRHEARLTASRAGMPLQAGGIEIDGVAVFLGHDRRNLGAPAWVSGS